MRVASALVIVVAWSASGVAVEPGPPQGTPRGYDASARVVATGRFAEGGKKATVEILSPREGITVTARLLTPRCRTKKSSLPHAMISQAAPLAVVDLDGDGRDEIILLDQGNTIDHAIILRVDRCRVLQVEPEHDSSGKDLAFYARGTTAGMGVLCRRMPSGKVEILEIEHSPWSELDMSDPDDHVVEVQHDHVDWTRRTLVVRGDRLVSVAEDRGTSTVSDDPSVPLLNRFDCVGSVYP